MCNSSFRNSNSLSVMQGKKKHDVAARTHCKIANFKKSFDDLNCSLLHANLPSDMKKHETPCVNTPNEFNVFRVVLHQDKHLSVILGGNPKTDLNTTVYQFHLEESTFKRNDVCKPITFLRAPEPTLFPPTFFAVKSCRKKSMSLTTTSKHPQAYYIWPCHHFHGEAVDGCHPPLLLRAADAFRSKRSPGCGTFMVYHEHERLNGLSVFFFTLISIVAGWWLNRPFEKSESNWEFSPSRGENFKKYLSCHHLDIGRGDVKKQIH